MRDSLRGRSLSELSRTEIESEYIDKIDLSKHNESTKEEKLLKHTKLTANPLTSVLVKIPFYDLIV